MLFSPSYYSMFVMQLAVITSTYGLGYKDLIEPYLLFT